jgi:hypothetical protein
MRSSSAVSPTVNCCQETWLAAQLLFPFSLGADVVEEHYTHVMTWQPINVSVPPSHTVVITELAGNVLQLRVLHAHDARYCSSGKKTMSSGPSRNRLESFHVLWSLIFLESLSMVPGCSMEWMNPRTLHQCSAACVSPANTQRQRN